MASQAMIDDAKAFLKQESPDSKLNTYDHLCSIIHSVLEGRIYGSADVVEDCSAKIKASAEYDHELDEAEIAMAQLQSHLFEKTNTEDADPEPEDEVEMPLPDLMDISFYFEQAGIGLGREETFRIFLALKNLVDTHTLQNVRFWGKVFGTKKNYIVAEVEYREGAEDEEGEEEETEEKVAEEEEEEDEKSESDDIPKPEFKPPPKIPREENGTGCNKKTYFVCNEPGTEWVKLPPVDPAEVSCARQIKKFFTGDLNAPVISYPPFPGNEMNYLRAQIARISAATHISPIDYFKFEEDDDDESDGEGRDSYTLNVEFESLPIYELVDPTLNSWVHHMQHILPQGRCQWINPNVKADNEEFDEDEEEEENEDQDEPIQEEGPPLLTTISQDDDVDGLPAWSAVRSSDLVPAYSVAVLRSNTWPGAYTFGVDKKFENVYIGFGHKYSSENYSPPPPPPVWEEYVTDLEVTEAPDPTVADEQALLALQQEQLEREAEEAEMEDDEDDED